MKQTGFTLSYALYGLVKVESLRDHGKLGREEKLALLLLANIFCVTEGYV